MINYKFYNSINDNNWKSNRYFICKCITSANSYFTLIWHHLKRPSSSLTTCPQLLISLWIYLPLMPKEEVIPQLLSPELIHCLKDMPEKVNTLKQILVFFIEIIEMLFCSFTISILIRVWDIQQNNRYILSIKEMYI